MTIELLDMDVPYSISTDINDDGIDFIKICPTPDHPDNDTCICLDYDGVQELIRTLIFISHEIRK